jgi:hypothetical protein
MMTLTPLECATLNIGIILDLIIYYITLHKNPANNIGNVIKILHIILEDIHIEGIFPSIVVI